MKIVLDTNIFVSGVFFTGPPFWAKGARSCNPATQGELLKNVVIQDLTLLFSHWDSQGFGIVRFDRIALFLHKRLMEFLFAASKKL